MLDQRTGLRADPPIKLMEVYRTSGGNLVAADGYLIVAQSDALVVFCQNSRLIERYRDEIARAPDQAGTYYRLARAAEAVGRDELALESYEQAALKAGTPRRSTGSTLADTARDHQFRLLARIADVARRAKRYDEAASGLEAAARISRSDTDRLRARLLLAEVQLEAGRPVDSVEILEQVLTDERLRGLTVGSEDGHRAIRADLLIADRLASIVRQRGREVYAQFDRRASELFQRGRQEQDPRLLDEVSRIYPVSDVVPDALLALGESTRRPAGMGPASQAYKRLLALAPRRTRPVRGPSGGWHTRMPRRTSWSRHATLIFNSSSGIPRSGSTPRGRRRRSPTSWRPSSPGPPWPRSPPIAPGRPCRSP